MPEAKNPQQVIDQPKGQKTAAASGPNIFVMPSKYRGGAAPMMQPAPPLAPAPPTKPLPPPPPPPIKKKAPPLKKKSSKKGLVIFGLVFLIFLSVGGFYALKTLQPPTETGSPVTPVLQPQPKPEPPVVVVPEPGPGEPGSPFPTATRPGADSDSDGLTDLEERLVYQTDPRLPDTDSDGFLDGNEVFHRYNPVALAPGTLLETGLVKVFIPPGEAYGIFYPSVWDIQADPNDPAKFMIQVTTGETITINLLDKNPNQTLSAWYQEQVDANGVFEITTKNNYPALLTDNQLTYYIDGGDRVIRLEYATGAKGVIDYLQTYQMMINSLELK
ncbi:hypothetical protein KJ611_00635 [Patescibacteria group bacterium]|nr:hypothetical protein [Patescibacteria group bacterium]MBU1705114.1 hypothetical protein [Patescibacteria group bacterium]